jgi:hypothetical protein
MTAKSFDILPVVSVMLGMPDRAGGLVLWLNEGTLSAYPFGPSASQFALEAACGDSTGKRGQCLRGVPKAAVLYQDDYRH